MAFDINVGSFSAWVYRVCVLCLTRSTRLHLGYTWITFRWSAGGESATKAREGDFVDTTDNLIFDVKGLVHPPDRIVAYLRYYPDKRGDRLRGIVRYSKVYELSKRERLLRKRWPQYLYYDETQGRELQGVPMDSIRALHTPQRRLSILMRSRKRGTLEKDAVGLVNALVRGSGLPPERFGISGSLMLGLDDRKSDIDIMAYGLGTAKSVQKTLFTLLKNDKRFHRYGLSDLRVLHVRRGLQRAIPFKDFVKQERRKALQGKFLGHDYFIRCVKDWPEITERYGDARYRGIGECTISGQVTDDKESLLTPCRYSIEPARVLSGVASPKPVELVSFRGRFAEQAKVGERVIARGRLETVQSAGSEYARLVVGEGAIDVVRVVG